MKYLLIAAITMLMMTSLIAAASDRQISVGDAMTTVQHAYGGKILSAQEDGNNFRIKLLTPQGEVIIVFVNRQSGQIE